MGREHPLTGRSADPRANLGVVAVRCDHVVVRWDHPVCPGARRLRSNGRTHRRRRQVDHASRHDQHDPIGHGRQRLGERADRVDPPPGPPSGRHDAATDLLGEEVGGLVDDVVGSVDDVLDGPEDDDSPTTDVPTSGATEGDGLLDATGDVVQGTVDTLEGVTGSLLGN